MHFVTSLPFRKKIGSPNHPAPALAVLLIAFATVPLAWVVAADAPTAPATYAGAWDGEVTLAGQAVHIRFDFKATPAGSAVTPVSAIKAPAGDPAAPAFPGMSSKTTVKSTTSVPGEAATPAVAKQPPAASTVPVTWSGTLTARQELGSHPLEKIQLTADSLACETVVDGARLRFKGTRAGRTFSGEVLFLNAAGETAQIGAFRVSGPPALSAATPAAQPGVTLEGDWEGTVRPAGAAASAAGTPLWLTLAKSGATWQGTLYIKSREPGAAFEKVTVEGNRLRAEATLDGRRVALEATLANAILQGDLTVRAAAAGTERAAEQRATWAAAPATRTGFQPRPAEAIAAHENPATPRPLTAETGLPVFPGAQGFGTRTPAGRGGKVIEVTTLDDSGPGSLRDALNTAGPRTIVFRVGGVIAAKDFLYVNEPFVTIAGETAPGDGICIVDAGLVITTHDVLVSHLRIRPGNQGKINPAHNDAICVLGDHKAPTGGAHHVVIDHVSASWSEDECVSVWGGARDITLSWCLIGEALSKSRHHKDTHSAGLLVGDSSEHVSIHHNLLAHNGFRNPLVALGGTHEFVNNVVYDWQDGAAEIYDLKSNTFLNFIGNTYLKGPSTGLAARALLAIPDREKGTPKLFVADNQDPHRTTAGDDSWSTVGGDWKGGPADLKLRAPAPFTTRGLKPDSALNAYPKVLAGAGALQPRRDSVDARLVNDVKNRTGKVIDNPAAVGGCPAYKSGALADLPADSDHDGLPDAWETARALNPHDPADGARDRNKDGYTNLEEYLHTLR